MQDVTGERIESQPTQRNRDSRHMIAKAVSLLQNLSHRGIRRDDIIGIGHPIEFDRGRTHHFFGEAMSGRADRLVFFRDSDRELTVSIHRPVFSSMRGTRESPALN